MKETPLPSLNTALIPSVEFINKAAQTLEGENSVYKLLIKINYLQSLNYELWNIVEAPYTKPSTNYDVWSEEQKKSSTLMPKQ